ncbi:HAD-IC family P-type ATPase [Mycobacterium sp. NPDC006124]|uniref:HAD-IC family P-type ATPase n=1 Tax=Mycobacterium sp. NPDC006124 TaxID=3156729 RepID=UPI0033B4E1D1
MASPALEATPPWSGDAAERSRLAALAYAPAFVAYQSLSSSPSGLTEASAARMAVQHGANRPGRYVDDRASTRVRDAAGSPFVALLAVFAAVLVAVGDVEGAVTVAVVVTATVVLRLWQRTRAVRAVRGLRRRVSATVTVRRRAGDGHPGTLREVPVEDLVPGDVVVLGAGDLVPADLRILASSGLTVDQSVVSGESRPVPKGAPAEAEPRGDVGFDTASLCFTGTTVVTGTATALAIATGTSTLHDALTRTAVSLRPRSSFDVGVRTVGLVLIRFMLVMAPIVFAVNGWVRGDWHQAALFAIAVAIGLTPEMLPVIVTANLARGAATLAGHGVVVNRLEAIQDLGAMDVLCVDETGTLTEDRVAYAHGLDPRGVVDRSVEELAHLAVSLQTYPHDALDEAIVERLADREAAPFTGEVDEIVFDHVRRMATVVVRRRAGRDTMITRGDPAAVLARCDRVRLGDQVVDLDDDLAAAAVTVVRDCGARGMRTLAVATRDVAARLGGYTARDEHDMVLVGFLGFVDPVKLATPVESARSGALHARGSSRCGAPAG